MITRRWALKGSSRRSETATLEYMELHFFDRKAEYTVIERRLPHWLQPGVVCFLTFRTDESIPLEVVERWRSERGRWLRLHGINPTASNWRHQLQQLDKSVQEEFYDHFSKRWHDDLDACHGACALRCRDIAEIVGNSLHHFDGDRYELLDFIVMPNHAHVLVAFLNETAMLAQCDSWKHFTAHKINRELKTKGRFWQQDGFDHLVRSEEQSLHLRRYISNNGVKAKLAPLEYLHYSKPLSPAS